MTRLARRLIALASLPLPGLPAADAATVHIGVLDFRPSAQTQEQWQPLAGALKRAIPGHDFVVEAFNYPELEVAIEKQQLDFILTNPGHYVLLAQRYGLSAPLATQIGNGEGEADLSKYADVAMYHAKECGRGNVQIFRPGMEETRHAA